MLLTLSRGNKGGWQKVSGRKNGQEKRKAQSSLLHIQDCPKLPKNLATSDEDFSPKLRMVIPDYESYLDHPDCLAPDHPEQGDLALLRVEIVHCIVELAPGAARQKSGQKVHFPRWRWTLPCQTAPWTATARDTRPTQVHSQPIVDF